MKTVAVWVLLFVGLVSLTACHWNRHHHHFADGIARAITFRAYRSVVAEEPSAAVWGIQNL